MLTILKEIQEKFENISGKQEAIKNNLTFKVETLEIQL